MTGTTDREILEVAVRVLGAWNRRRLPALGDVAVLRRAFPSAAHLESDDLACHVVDTLARRMTVRQARHTAVLSAL